MVGEGSAFDCLGCRKFPVRDGDPFVVGGFSVVVGYGADSGTRVFILDDLAEELPEAGCQRDKASESQKRGDDVFAFHVVCDGVVICAGGGYRVIFPLPSTGYNGCF